MKPLISFHQSNGGHTKEFIKEI